MNGAHIHLVVNHFPIVGLFIGVLVLLSGFLLKKPQVKITALGIFVLSALGSVAAFISGEEAEEVVEILAVVSDTMIHQHEEFAEVFMIMMLVLGGISLITAYLEFKKSKFSKKGYILVVLISLANIFISKYVGTSGGEITHVEIRINSDVIKVESDED